VVDRSKRDTPDPHQNEVAELLRVAQVAVVDQLHQQKHVKEDLALGHLGDFTRTLCRAVEFVLNVFVWAQRCRLTGQLKAIVKIGQVKLDEEDGVGQIVGLAQLFELFG